MPCVLVVVQVPFVQSVAGPHARFASNSGTRGDDSVSRAFERDTIQSSTLTTIKLLQQKLNPVVVAVEIFQNEGARTEKPL